ncbi:MAG: glucose 1-dehydrogenase [Thaumarchaeota archaeon]|nr:glucose 1-dehydrogenase [Nitrososphaerota archaeon]MBI3116763.1 glucose 1-dehydrogenase [Nitrososphaerota archaeon]
MRLRGRTAVVTGSSRGVGAAVARAYASEGARVVVNYRASAGEAEKVVDSIEKRGGRAIAIQADVSSPSDVQMMFGRVKRKFGGLDILVNCAGVADGNIWKASVNDLKLESWRRVFGVDVFGTFLCVQEAVRLMERKGGKIINISSTPVLTGDTQGLVYASAKASTLTMTKMLARMLAPEINVNCMILGAIDTTWVNWLSQKEIGNLKSSIPLKRFGEPDEVANLAVFLASEEANYITGQGIVIDGGEVMD